MKIQQRVVKDGCKSQLKVSLLALVKGLKREMYIFVVKNIILCKFTNTVMLKA